MAKATRAEREMEQILQICALRDELRTVREELNKTRTKLTKADNELNAAAYDLERQGRELAEARKDSARLDAVENMRIGVLPGMPKEKHDYWFVRRYDGNYDQPLGETIRAAIDAAMGEAK